MNQKIKEANKYTPEKDEVCFEAEWNDFKVNGWDATQIVQNLCRQAKNAIKEGWRPCKFRLRLSIWLQKDDQL